MVQGGVTNKITVAQLFTNPVQQTYEDFTGIVTAATDAKTWSIRLTAPATVNAHACIEFEE